MSLSAPSDNKRQAKIAILHKRFEDGAVGGDDANAAVFLPERKGLSLGDGDLQAVWVELEHGRIGDPGIRHQPGPRSVGVEEKQRRMPGHAGDGEYLFAADFLRSGERNGRNPKTNRIGALVAGILQPIDDVGDVTAGDGAVTERCSEQQNRSGDAKSRRRRQPRDPGVPPPHPSAVGR